MAQVTTDLYQDIAEFMTARLSGVRSAAGALRGYIEGNIEYVATHRTQMKALLDIFMSGALTDGEHSLAALVSVDAVEQILRDGQAGGEFRSFDVTVVAACVQRSIDAVPMLLESRPDLDLTACAEEMATVFDLATRSRDHRVEGRRAMISTGQTSPEQAQPEEPTKPASRIRGVLLLLLDMAGPIVAFYIFRSMGLSSFLSLLLSAAIPALSTLYQVVRSRHLDSLAIFMMGITVVSAVASLIGGNPRFLLAKDGYVTSIAGIWMLATTRANPPVAFMFARPLLEGRTGPKGANWGVLWKRLPDFRRIWRVASVIWGVAIILDAGVRLVLAYTLPVDTVPAVNGIQWAVVFVLIQIVTNVYYFRAGLYNPQSEMYAPLAQEPAAATPAPKHAMKTTGSERPTAEA